MVKLGRGLGAGGTDSVSRIMPGLTLNPPSVDSLPRVRNLSCDGDGTADGASGSDFEVSIAWRCASGESEASNSSPWGRSAERFFWHKAPLTANRMKEVIRIGVLCFTVRSCKGGKRLLGCSAIQPQGHLDVNKSTGRLSEQECSIRPGAELGVVGASLLKTRVMSQYSR